MKVLVIDDSRAMRIVISKMLQSLGYEVVDAGNGVEGFERLGEDGNGITLVMLDWNMPEMNGYDFVVKMRDDSRYSDIRIMMVTTETERDQVKKALSAGADEYLMKPFTKESILQKVCALNLGMD